MYIYKHKLKQQIQSRPTYKIEMFFDTLTTMLHKQNLSDYLVSKLSILKIHPTYKLDPYLVQAISSDIVSDGITNFHVRYNNNCSHCNADQADLHNGNKNKFIDRSMNRVVKKGSVIRLVDWKLDFKNFDIVVESWQYLGGAGYGVKSGRPWDIQKLKLITNSEIISKDFIVLYNPALKDKSEINKFKLPATTQRYFSTATKTRQYQRPQKQVLMHSPDKQQKYKSQQNTSLKTEQQVAPHEIKSQPIPTPYFKNDSHSHQHQHQKQKQKQKQKQIEIERVEKLKIPSESQQNNRNVLLNLSTRSLMSRKKDWVADDDKGSQKNSIVNEDSLGRQLVFNQDEIKKLLGKEE